MLTFKAPKTKILIEQPEITRKSGTLPNPEYAEPTAITKTCRSTPVCPPEKLLPRLPGPHVKSKKINQKNKTLSAVGENYFNDSENYSNAGKNNSGERKNNFEGSKNYSGVNTKNSRPVFYGWEVKYK